MRLSRGLVVLGLLTIATPALAAPPDTARAQELYRKGMARYNLGDFDAAIEAFKQAYELSEAPGLLFNLAQASRLAGRPRQALHFYKSYLRMWPEAPNREDAELRIRELEPAPPRKPLVVAGPVPLSLARAPGPPGRALLWSGIGTASGGIALLAAGIGLGVASGAADSQISTTPKPKGNDSTAAAQNRGEAIAADVLYAAGGAAVVTGVVLIAVGAHARTLRHVSVGALPGGAAAMASFRF
jgi:tetratricopeptide (TPR) repeat protein